MMIPAEARENKKELTSYVMGYLEDNNNVVQDREILVALQSLGYKWEWDEENRILSKLTRGSFDKIYVTKIEKVVEETADLSVPGTHSYTANGITSHNTYNLPSDYTLEDYKKLIRNSFDVGLSGFTSFNPKGFLAPILSAPKKKEDEEGEGRRAPKRPKELPCEIHLASSRGQKYIFIVGLYEGKPYEVFATELTEDLQEVRKIKEGVIRKVKRGHYQLVIGNGDKEIIIDNISQTFNEDYEAVQRLISLILRHQKAELQFLVEQLGKAGSFGTWGKTVSNVLKKYIEDGSKASGVSCPECGSDNLAYVEGCLTCKNCGNSQCG